MAADSEKKVLFLFAHPDDELAVSIGIRDLRRRGDNVRALWMTRGDLTADPEVRQAESIKVMANLGLEADRLTFWHYPDASSFRHLGEIIENLLNYLDDFRPDEVYVDAFEGGHIDHDTVHLALIQAVKRLQNFSPKLFEFPQYNNFWVLVMLKYNTFIPDVTPVRFFPLKPWELVFKYQLAHLYESQKDTIDQLGLFMLLNWPRMLIGEPYREIPARRNYLKKPHRGKLHYETFLPVTHADFRAVAEKVMGENNP